MQDPDSQPIPISPPAMDQGRHQQPEAVSATEHTQNKAHLCAPDLQPQLWGSGQLQSSWHPHPRCWGAPGPPATAGSWHRGMHAGLSERKA